MVGQRDNQFYNELKQLNKDFIDYLKATNDKSPYFDFTATVMDYAKQFSDLDKQYPEKKTTSQIPLPVSQAQPSQVPKLTPFSSATPFTPGASLFGSGQSVFSTAATSIAPNSTPFNSASTLSSATTGQQQQPFMFGSAMAQAAAPTNAGTKSFFSFNMAKKEGDADSANDNALNTTADNTFKADTTNQDEEEDVPPPEPKIDRYEEPDHKYSTRCKLYEKSKVADPSGEINLKLLGIGTLYVKPMDAPNKLQVIVRQEPDLLRVLLNEVVSSNIPVKILPKAVQMVFPLATGETKIIIVKVKDDNDANTLHQVLNSVKGC